MPVNWHGLFAERTARMRRSDIREMLKVASVPGLISLAGGLPAPELFPIDEYRRAFEYVLEAQGTVALQYGPTEGYQPLRGFLASRLGKFGISCSADDVLVTNGSQQALDLIAKIFLNPGDHVALERPSYLGAIQAFDQYQPGYTVVPMDDEGMDVDALTRILEEDCGGARPRRIKLIYVIPNFQNPTGRTMSRARREQLVRVATHFGVPVVEDDPYGELRYEGDHVPSLMSFDTAGTVIYLGTFSKILAPGFRLGWVVGPPDAIEALVHAKQPSDLQTGSATQMATYEVARDGFIDTHVERIKHFYRERRDVMLQTMGEVFPPSVHFTRPEGGLFVWAELPEQVNAHELLLESTREGVAFVPGSGFHADGTGQNTMRLNFSNVPPERLRDGVQRLGIALQRSLDRASAPRSVAV